MAAGDKQQPHLNIVVEGAGCSEVNGVYRPDGHYCGFRVYQKCNSAPRFSIFKCEDGDMWYLSVIRNRDPSSEDMDFYRCGTEGADSPPSTGWIICSHGIGPAPTLKFVSPGSATLRQQQSKTLLQGLSNSLNDPAFADVSFLMDDDKEPIHAHRVVLARGCDYFDHMFRSGMKESIAGSKNDKQPIPIPNVRKQTFLLLLQFVYGDDIDSMGPEDAVDLYGLAHMYNMAPLQEICVNTIEQELTVENVSQLLRLAGPHEAIQKPCLDFSVKHYRQVTKTEGFGKLSQELLVRISRTAAERYA